MINHFFPSESLIWIKEQSNDCPNFYSVKTLLNPNIKSHSKRDIELQGGNK